MGVVSESLLIPIGLIALYAALGAIADRRSLLVRQVLVWLSVVLTVRFMVWRFWNTFPLTFFSIEDIIALALLVCELLVTRSALLDLLAHRRVRNRSREVDEHLHWYGDKPPLIDVLIPTYNEPLEVLERTIACCLGVRYPNYRVWLLDDGKRDTVREFAAKQGIQYLRRDSNQHFKAGNLNNALAHIMRQENKPEFFAVLDADFMPRERFLERTLSLMKTSDVGLVQTPQCFFNPDPIQYAFDGFAELPDEQRYFFDERQLALDTIGSAFCCGTSFLIRARALVEAGGFPTESVTEDVLTTLALRSKGWRTVYLHEHLTTGLAPEGLAEYLTQRGRWCLGHVQITQSSYGALRARGGLVGRVRYLHDSLEWAMHGLIQVLYLLLPTIYVLTGFAPVKAPFDQLAGYVLPMVLQQWAWAWATGGLVMPMFFEGVRLIALPAVLKATAGAVLFPGRKVKFAVTDKGRRRDEPTFHWQAAAWFLVPIAALLVSHLAVVFDETAHARAADLGIWFWGWTFASLAVFTIALWPCYERPKYRADERHPSGLESTLRTSVGLERVALMDVSLGGASIVTRKPLSPGDTCELHVHGVGWVSASVVRAQGDSLGVRFNHTSESRDELIRALYSRSPPQRHKNYSIFTMARKVAEGLAAGILRAFLRVTGIG